MAHLQLNDRLSAEDAVFYYLETKDMPLHIGAVLVFEGPLPLDDCLELVRRKLPELPRYQQRIVEPPFNIGHPTWEIDPNFNLRNHIHSVRLRRGTEAEFQTLVGKTLSAMMDRRKPLWDLTLVDGLKGGRGAMIVRLHHCMADGIAGIDFMSLILDPAPLPYSHPEPVAEAPPLRDGESSLIDAVLSSYTEMLERILSVQSAALNIAEALVLTPLPALSQLARLVPDLLNPVERLPFNRPCPGARKLVWTEVSMAEVKAIREVYGAKLNDVVLTVVAAAVRSYTRLHRKPVKNRRVRMMVPVNIRARDAIGGSPLGNRISMIPINIPLDVADPVELLNIVRETTCAFKGASVAEFITMAGNWVGMIPSPLQAVLGPYGGRLPHPPFNMVTTNVPGPQFPLYGLGRKVLSVYPYVPVGAQMGLNVAIESYNGTLYFGFTGSEVAVPDVAIVPRLLDQAFAELRTAAAGVQQPVSQPVPQPKPEPARPRGHKPKPHAPAASANAA
jgi:diacylglycerol O-acyltransferase